jgi:uncharacterized protein with GYD domain
MAEIPPLNVRVILNASGVQAGVAQATEGLQQISARADVAKAKMTSLGVSFKTLAKGLITTGGIIALSNAIRGMRDEAIATEVELARLGTVLDNVGVTTEADQAKIADYAGSFEKLGFGGSTAVSAMGTLITATGSVEQSTRLMGIAADYARFKHIGLDSAARLMARGTQGAARAFKEMGITLDASLPKNEAIAKAFDELNKKIGGSATKYTETFAGRMEVLRERFEAFLENAIAPLLPYLTKFAGILVGAAEWIQNNSTALKVYGGIILVVTTYLKGMAIISAILAGINPFTWIVIGVAALGVGFVLLWNKFEGFRKAMATGLAVIVAAIGYLVGGISKLLNIMSKIPGMGFLKGVAEGADSIAMNLGKAAESIEKMSSKKLSVPKIPTMPDFVKPGSSTGIKGNVTGGNTAGGSGGGSGTVQYVTVYASNTNDIAKKLAKAAKNGQPIGGK